MVGGDRLVSPPLVGRLPSVVVDVTGDDRSDYLDDVLSQRLRDLDPPTATSALALGPHGEPEAVLDIAVLPDRLVALVPAAQADDAIERLAGRTFLADAQFTRRDDHTALRVRGAADALLADLGAGDVHGELTVTALPDGNGEALWLRWHHGADVVVPSAGAAQLEEAIVAAGAARATPEELDAAEIAAGVPRAPEEITRGRLPEELGLLPTHVHLDKGCYPGQEAVARMWMLGRPRRKLAVVELPDQAGSGHVVDETGAVEVTRTAQIDDRTIGLAFVARDTTTGDRPHPGVEVLAIVGEGRDVPGHDPEIPRRRDRRDR